DAGECREHLALGADALGPRAITGLEATDERNVHAADEPDRVRAARPRHQRRERTDEERAFLFAKLERHHVRRRSDEALRPELDVVDAREVRPWILERDVVEVVGEDEADPDDEVEAARGEQPDAALAIRAIAGLDHLHVDAELASGALHATVGRV